MFIDIDTDMRGILLITLRMAKSRRELMRGFMETIGGRQCIFKGTLDEIEGEKRLGIIAHADCTWYNENS